MPSRTRREQIEEVFVAALEQPTAHRDAWLASQCAGDDALRAEVEALLAAHGTTSGILEANAAEIARTLAGDRASERYIGPYRVVRELGRGGMGVVYLAERADGQYRRQVAIKLLRSSPDADELHRRFLAERQILASLNHPNIAQLLDGGTTDGQLPYLVMEYVDGLPITHYCDRQRLDVPARLRLFEDVCRAVHAAHQNLIIHRDIKPGNILVLPSGQVKLLDFGIAKLLNPSIGALDLPYTQASFRVMTPEYASPEQVRGDSLSTSSDIYALGVVLYELLVGRRPYELRSGTPAELQEMVCEREPDRPSDVVRARHERDGDTALDGRGAEATAAARGVTPERLHRQLRGDVDAMVMMALRKEPRRRYGSAELLCDDIARYLAGRPVVARPPSRAYHLGKFLARHRAPVAAGLLAVSSLAGGTAVALRQAAIAGRERDRATAALDRVEQTLRESEEMTDFLVGLFDASAPTPLGDRPGTTDDLLRRGAVQVERLGKQPLVQARTLDGMGRVYRAVGRLGDARVALERSLVLRRANGAGESAEAASTMVQLADVLRRQGMYVAAESTSRGALALRQRVLGPTHPGVADVLAQLSGLAVYRGALLEGESLARRALAIRRAALGDDDPRVAASLELLAGQLRRRGAFDEAEQRFRESVAHYERTLGTDDPTLVFVLQRLGDLYMDRERFAEAEPLYERALAICEKTLGPDHPQTSFALGSLTTLRVEQGRYADAERLASRALGILQRTMGARHLSVADASAALARVYLRAGRFEEAERFHREGMRIAEGLLGREHSSYAGGLSGLGDILVASGRLDEAEATYRQAIDIRSRALGGQVGVVALTIARLADVRALRGDFASADSLYRRALEILTAGAQPDGREVRRIYRQLASLHAGHGRPLEAARFAALAEGGASPR